MKAKELERRINERFKEKEEVSYILGDIKSMRDIAIEETRKKMFEIFKNFVRMELAAQQSDLTEEEAMEISEKINKGIYEKIVGGKENEI